MKCPKCNGETTVMNLCAFCWGEKDLDWIDVLFGVNIPKPIIYAPYIPIVMISMVKEKYMKCPKCEGKKENIKEYFFCDFCYGREKLDWVESILGVDLLKSKDDMERIDKQLKIWIDELGIKNKKCIKDHKK